MPAVSQARSIVGTIASRWARLATSGTTPPNRACSSTLLATASASSVWPRTIPTPVSSHEVSMPSTSGSCHGADPPAAAPARAAAAARPRSRRPGSTAAAGPPRRSRARRRTPARPRCPSRTSSSIRSALAVRRPARRTPSSRSEATPVRRAAGVTAIRCSSATSPARLATAWPDDARRPPRRPGSGSSAAGRPGPRRPGSSDQASAPRFSASSATTAARSSAVGRADGRHETGFGALGHRGVGTAQVERLGVAAARPAPRRSRGPASRRSGRVGPTRVRERLGVEQRALAHHRQLGRERRPACRRPGRRGATPSTSYDAR